MFCSVTVQQVTARRCCQSPPLLTVRPDASSSSSSSGGGGSIQQLGRKGAKEGGHDAQTQLAILHTSSAQIGCVTSKKNTHTQQGWSEKSRGIQGGSALVHNATRQSWAKMVKLGNNFAEKNNGKAASEDGFDTIPLITPLDASQLQFPPTDKVVVKTKAEYDGESKKGKLRSPKIAEFSISIIEGVSERLKVTLLVICALAFLVCVGFLVVYKLYQYDQPCPDSFIYVQGHCMPTGLYGNYPPQGPGGRGRLFTLINRYNMAKQTITRSVSPWVTIMSEEKVTQQEMETAQKLA